MKLSVRYFGLRQESLVISVLMLSDIWAQSLKLEERVCRIERRLQQVEKRAEKNFGYIDRYDDSFGEVFKRLKKI